MKVHVTSEPFSWNGEECRLDFDVDPIDFLDPGPPLPDELECALMRGWQEAELLYGGPA